MGDEMVNVLGLNIYGSPWTPTVDGHSGAFTVRSDSARMKRICNKISKDVDVLVTHSAPFGHGDYADDANAHIGEKSLLNRVRKINSAQFHVFAHIHEGYGVTRESHLETMFVNAALTHSEYEEMNKPIMVYAKGKRVENVHDEL